MITHKKAVIADNSTKEAKVPERLVQKKKSKKHSSKKVAEKSKKEAVKEYKEASNEVK